MAAWVSAAAPSSLRDRDHDDVEEEDDPGNEPFCLSIRFRRFNSDVVMNFKIDLTATY